MMPGGRKSFRNSVILFALIGCGLRRWRRLGLFLRISSRAFGVIALLGQTSSLPDLAAIRSPSRSRSLSKSLSQFKKNSSLKLFAEGYRSAMMVLEKVRSMIDAAGPSLLEEVEAKFLNGFRVEAIDPSVCVFFESFLRVQSIKT